MEECIIKYKGMFNFKVFIPQKQTKKYFKSLNYFFPFKEQEFLFFGGKNN